jgi:hypothetical protein
VSSAASYSFRAHESTTVRAEGSGPAFGGTRGREIPQLFISEP